MKKILYYAGIAVLVGLSGVQGAMAQIAFHKKALLLSISEGSTQVSYATGYQLSNQFTTIHSEHEHGNRDPIILEYGISKRFGLGFTCGTDLFKVNTSVFYPFDHPAGVQKTTSSDFTLDASYHFYVTNHTDLSGVLGFGGYGVKVNTGDNYDAKQGHISRFGIRGRYYFRNRLGVFGMLSFYNAMATPKEVQQQSGTHLDMVYSPVTTRVHGRALEFGLSYRFF